MNVKKIADTESLTRNWVLSEKIYIYGAGSIAEALLEYLADKTDARKLEGIIVSDKTDMPRFWHGFPVSGVDEPSICKSTLVIVATRENLHKNILKVLEKEKYENILCLSDQFAVFIEKDKPLIKKQELEKERLINLIEKEKLQKEDINSRNIANTERIVNYVRNQMLRFVPRPCIEYMVLNILDHCNLRCKGCDHFACIAEPYFVSSDTVGRDLARMSELLQGDNLTQIGVMGGEPLLHPELLSILKLVRLNFPSTIIRLTTNGLLLLKQPEIFWETCRNENVTIVNTKYPINLDHEAMQAKAEKEKVKFIFFEGTGGNEIKKSFKKSINLQGTSDPVKSFADCHISNYGNFLMEGKLYGCPFSCQSYRIFNKKYNQNLRLSEKDYLDIYKVKDMQEILDFAARPRPYCRYCSGRVTGFEWTRSKQDIHEWVDS